MEQTSEQEQPEKEEQVSSGKEQETSAEDEVPQRMGRLRRAFGFLGAPPFWGGLVVGILVLGAGVIIGLGAAWWMDEDGRRDDDRRGEAGVTFRIGPEEEWSGMGEGKGRWKKGFGWRHRGWEDLPSGEGAEIPERIGELIDEVEELVEKLADMVDGEEDFGAFLDRFFGSDGFFGGGFGDEWDDGSWDGRFGEEHDKGAGSSEGKGGAFGEDGGLWDEVLPGGDFARFMFPFGEVLSGFMTLENCDVEEFELLEIPDDLEDLPDQGGDEASAEEDLEEFFDSIADWLREVCETAPDG